MTRTFAAASVSPYVAGPHRRPAAGPANSSGVIHWTPTLGPPVVPGTATFAVAPPGLIAEIVAVRSTSSAGVQKIPTLAPAAGITVRRGTTFRAATVFAVVRRVPHLSVAVLDRVTSTAGYRQRC